MLLRDRVVLESIPGCLQYKKLCYWRFMIKVNVEDRILKIHELF